MALLVGHIGGDRVAPWDTPRSAPNHVYAERRAERGNISSAAQTDPIYFGRDRSARDRRAAVVFLAHQLAAESVEPDRPEEFSDASDAYRRSQEMTQEFDRPLIGTLDRYENGRALPFLDVLV
jgi:hypothetical protein